MNHAQPPRPKRIFNVYQCLTCRVLLPYKFCNHDCVDGTLDPGFGEGPEVLDAFADFVMDVQSNPHWNIQINVLPNCEENWG